jgi:molybdate transport system regulatory protein
MIRLHLWLENGEELFFGMGRAQLLVLVERLGSVKRAAEHLGMSYRAAWGKLQQSERALGAKLLERRGARCEGLRLTPEARQVVQAYQAWYAAVESAAFDAAARHLPFAAQPFHAGHTPAAEPPE